MLSRYVFIVTGYDSFVGSYVLLIEKNVKVALSVELCL